MKCVKGKYHTYSKNVGLQGHDVNHSRSQCYSIAKNRCSKDKEKHVPQFKIEFPCSQQDDTNVLDTKNFW